MCALEGYPTSRSVELQLLSHARELVPTARTCAQDPEVMAAYTQGLMDLGATVCTRSRPKCEVCPLQKDCLAHLQGRCDELPWPRARKVLPERSTAMLVAHQAGQVLLTKRPTAGIWGGLWSLPEYDPQLAPTTACKQLGLIVKTVDTLAEFLHVFTHYRLTIRPYLVHTEPDGATHLGASQNLVDGGEWVPIHRLHERGLPAPVRKLLDGLTAARLIDER